MIRYIGEDRSHRLYSFGKTEDETRWYAQFLRSMGYLVELTSSGIEAKENPEQSIKKYLKRVKG